MIMAYPLETYLRIDDTLELQRRMHSLEILCRPYKLELEFLQRIINDPVFAQQEVEKWKTKIADLQTDISTIKQAIQILNSQEDDDE